MTALYEITVLLDAEVESDGVEIGQAIHGFLLSLPDVKPRSIIVRQRDRARYEASEAFARAPTTNLNPSRRHLLRSTPGVPSSRSDGAPGRRPPDADSFDASTEAATDRTRRKRGR